MGAVQAGVGRWGGVVAVAVAFLIANIAPASADAGDAAALAKRMDAAITSFSGNASVVLVDVQSGYRYAWQAERVVPSASLYKLGVMVEAYRRAAEGSLSLDSSVTITDDDLTDDGYFTPPGTVLSIREAIERMITISDNSPARALVHLLDPYRINTTMSSLGYSDTRINTDLLPDDQLAPFNTTTARDIGALFLGLSRGEVIGPAWSREMLAVLGRQQINDRLPAGLPPGTAIAHKTGNLDGVSHDAGLVSGHMGPRVIVMLTTDASGDDDVVTLAERLGAIADGTPLDAFAARFDRVPGAQAVRPGGFARWETQVRNASTFTWGSSTYLIERLRGASEVRELARIPLPAVAPGASLPLVINVTAPPAPGTYVVEVEVVDADAGTSGNTLQLILVVQP